MVKKIFAGSTLLTMLSIGGGEVYGIVKRNREKLETMTLNYREVKIIQKTNGLLLKEVRQDIKTILREMPRRRRR